MGQEMQSARKLPISLRKVSGFSRSHAPDRQQRIEKETNRVAGGGSIRSLQNSLLCSPPTTVLTVSQRATTGSIPVSWLATDGGSGCSTMTSPTKSTMAIGCHGTRPQSRPRPRSALDHGQRIAVSTKGVLYYVKADHLWMSMIVRDEKELPRFSRGAAECGGEPVRCASTS